MPEINILVSDAKVMSKGQVTIPKKIREALGVAPGDRVTLMQCRIFAAKEKTLNTVNHSRVGMDLFPFYFHPYI